MVVRTIVLFFPWDLNLLHVFSLELALPFFKASLYVAVQVRSSDTSTAESGSEVEEMASPKSSRSYLQSRLTPVSEEVRVLQLITLCQLIVMR